MLSKKIVCSGFILLSAITHAQTPVSSEFTYQGQLKNSGSAAHGVFDFDIELYDANSGGSTIGNQFFDDVTVSDGIFTLNLDFGYGPFSGDQMWLEINVRPGNSVGGFQQMLPRQIIQSNPYAIHAQFAGPNAVNTEALQDGSITSQKIQNQAIGADQVKLFEIQGRITGTCVSGSYVNAINQDGSVNCEVSETGLDEVTGANIVDGSIATVDLADDIINNTKIADASIDANHIQNGTVGSGQINDSEVQRRVSSGCSVGEYIQSINQDGSVVCQTDESGVDEVLSSDIADGTIQTIDLADGIINNDKLADNSVDSNSIQNSAVGVNEIKTSEVQRRVNQSCDEGFYLTGINEDGSVNCVGLPFTQTIVTDSQTGVVYTQTLIDSSGLPVIPYSRLDVDTTYLNIFQCSNTLCSEGQDLTVNHSMGLANNGRISAAMNPNSGLIDIAFIENGVLNILSCNDSSCSTQNTVPLDSAALNPSLAYSSLGNPLISYYDNANGYLKIYSCTATDCSQGAATILDNSGNTGETSSIALRPGNNLAMISYADDSNGFLNVFDCSNTACDTGTIRTLDNSGEVGSYGSDIAINPTTGFPAIAYRDAVNSRLNYIYCTDINCTTNEFKILSNSFGSLQYGHNPQLLFSTDGKLYVTQGTLRPPSQTGITLRVCLDYNCIGSVYKDINNIIENDTGTNSSLALGTDGNPVITYINGSNSALKTYHCADSICIK